MEVQAPGLPLAGEVNEGWADERRLSGGRGTEVTSKSGEAHGEADGGETAPRGGISRSPCPSLINYELGVWHSGDLCSIKAKATPGRSEWNWDSFWDQ